VPDFSLGSLLCLTCEILRFPYGPVLKAPFLPTPWESFTVPYVLDGGDFWPETSFARTRPEALLQSVRMDGGRSRVMLRYGQPVVWHLSAWGGFAGNTASGEKLWAVGGGFPGGHIAWGVWSLNTLWGDTLRYVWGQAAGRFQGVQVSGMMEEGGGWVEMLAGWGAFRWYRDDGRVALGVNWRDRVQLGGFYRKGRVMPWLRLSGEGGMLSGGMLPESLSGYLLSGAFRLAWDVGRVAGRGFLRIGRAGLAGGELGGFLGWRFLWVSGGGVILWPPEAFAAFPYGAEGLLGLRWRKELHHLKVGGGGVWMGGEVWRPDRLFFLGRVDYGFGEVFWLRGEGGWGQWLSWDLRGFPDPPWFTRVTVGAWIAD